MGSKANGGRELISTHSVARSTSANAHENRPGQDQATAQRDDAEYDEYVSAMMADDDDFFANIDDVHLNPAEENNVRDVIDDDLPQDFLNDIGNNVSSGKIQTNTCPRQTETGRLRTNNLTQERSSLGDDENAVDFMSDIELSDLVDDAHWEPVEQLHHVDQSTVNSKAIPAKDGNVINSSIICIDDDIPDEELVGLDDIESVANARLESNLQNMRNRTQVQCLTILDSDDDDFEV